MLSNKPFLAITKFVVYLAVARLFPERSWDSIAHAIATLSSLYRRGHKRQEIDRIESVLGRSLTKDEARKTTVERSADAFLTGFIAMGQKYSKGRSQNIRVFGLENIAAAREAGKGTILWLCPFTYTHLIAKIGLHREGVEISHLSRASHGFGPSRVAVRFLNRHWLYGENLYLKERLVMTADNETGALRALYRRLRDNGVVSITLGQEGKKCASTPFLTGSLTVATGVLGLAVSTRAAVLPVYALRDDEGGFEVTIDRPLAAGPGTERDAQFDHLLKDLADRLTPLVTRNPERCSNWDIFSSSE